VETLVDGQVTVGPGTVEVTLPPAGTAGLAGPAGTAGPAGPAG